MSPPLRSNMRTRLVCWVAGMAVLLTWLIPTGCARRNQPVTRLVQPSRNPLLTGYDPTWSPNGEQISYVESAYRSSGINGIFFDSSDSEPVPRDVICIWDVRNGSRRTVRLPLFPRSFVTSLVWKNDHSIVCLVSDLGRVDPERFKGRWHWLAIYRHSEVPKDLVVMDLRAGTFTAMRARLGSIPIEIEPCSARGGSVAVWEYERRNHSDAERLRTSEIIDSDGKPLDKLELPTARWSGVAVATRLTTVPVAVRASAEWKRCLSRIDGQRYEDFYCPDRMIEGVYGSPDGKLVAFLEQIPGQLPGPRMHLKVIEVDGGAPKLVAGDAWPWSHVAWSPDGKRIAYVKADSGEVAIAKVPK